MNIFKVMLFLMLELSVLLRAGVLITVTHGIRPPGPYFENIEDVSVMARRVGTTIYYKTSIIPNTWGAHFGLTLLQLEISEDDVVNAIEFPDSLSPLEFEDEVSCIFDIDRSSSNLLNGYISYPFRGEIIVPDDEFGGFGLIGFGDLEPRILPRLLGQEFFEEMSTVVAIQEMVVGFEGYVKSLATSMPLIQVSRLAGKTMDGISGFPVFAKDQNLVGLVLLSVGRVYLLIPFPVLQKVYIRNLDVIHAFQVSSRERKRGGKDEDGGEEEDGGEGDI